MREILFRGKILTNKGWVYGLLTDIGIDEKENVAFVSGVMVHKSTVGQYTGLTDKNGKKIFEGDIVEYARDEEIGEIAYHESEAMFVVEFDTWLTDFDHLYGKDVEVIGNIHDNPELLKGGEG